ncbi:hypothetical protein [Aequorivita sp. Q41]|uniref:hypothetical protein n=1 Tax=Aequorivita sp. Q41 TaxID=3153300 RepID=UPI003241EF1E
MAKTFYTILFLIFGSSFCAAQKVIQKEFSSNEIHAISIKDDAIYSINVEATERKTVLLAVYISGEHSESVVIEERLSDGTLALNTGFMPFFTLENDKLAAHKVMAIEIKLTVPKTISVVLKSKLASLETKGAIKDLAVFLQDGNCTLIDYSGNAHLKTRNGNITVHAQKTVSGSAISENGTVENLLLKNGEYIIEAESINGNIWLLQTK